MNNLSQQIPAKFKEKNNIWHIAISVLLEEAYFVIIDIWMFISTKEELPEASRRTEKNSVFCYHWQNNRWYKLIMIHAQSHLQTTHIEDTFTIQLICRTQDLIKGRRKCSHLWWPNQPVGTAYYSRPDKLYIRFRYSFPDFAPISMGFRMQLFEPLAYLADNLLRTTIFCMLLLEHGTRQYFLDCLYWFLVVFFFVTQFWLLYTLILYSNTGFH